LAVPSAVASVELISKAKAYQVRQVLKAIDKKEGK
jgi:hypothetical protein